MQEKLKVTIFLFTFVGYFLLVPSIFGMTQENQIQGRTIEIKGLEILDKNWIKEIVPLSMDTSIIEKYYIQKLKREYPKNSLFYIGKLAISPIGDRIAFSVNDDSVWVVRNDGLGLLCVACEQEPSHSPEWTKDGRQITFIKGEDENYDWHGVLMGVAPNGTQKKIIGEFDIRWPSKQDKPANKAAHSWRYSPNGKYILMWNLGKLPDYNAYVVRVKDKKVIATYKSPISIDKMLWFPNGKEILINEFKGSGVARLFVFSISGKRMRILSSGEISAGPVIHPSGQFIAYFDGYKETLYFLTKDGSKNYQVLKTKGFIGDMVWTPDGSTLIFEYDNKLYFLKLRR